MEGGGEHKKRRNLIHPGKLGHGEKEEKDVSPPLLWRQHRHAQRSLPSFPPTFLFAFFKRGARGSWAYFYSCLMIYIDIPVAVKATEIQSKIRLANYCIHYPVLVS